MADVRLTTTNAFNAALSGLKANEDKLGKAVEALNRAAAVNSNAVAKAEAPPAEGDVVDVSDEAIVTDAVRGAAVPAGSDGDLLKPLVDILQAKTAYKANLETLKVTADIESDTVKLLRRDV